MSDKCVLLFSGGTDSFCSAAILAERFREIHLITYFERATAGSPVPKENVAKLRLKFPAVTFRHFLISTDQLIRKISYERYFVKLVEFGFYNLCTPGISSLSWHVRTIRHCLKNKIEHVFDGMTQELVHLPGHNPEVRKLFSELYRGFNIQFSSPVIDWEVPPDQRYVDRLIIDRHGFTESVELIKEKTTGWYLYEKGLLPHPNVKGSLFDHKMQHDCYPFVVFNMFVFWWAYPLYGEIRHAQKLCAYMADRLKFARTMLQNSGMHFEPENELI